MKQKQSVILERRHKIKSLFAEHQMLQVSQISKLLGVSELTIRRDLDALVQEGFIERIHGGGFRIAIQLSRFSRISTRRGSCKSRRSQATSIP